MNLRNLPCLCGSGKKAKKCCLRSHALDCARYHRLADIGKRPSIIYDEASKVDEKAVHRSVERLKKAGTIKK